MDRSEKPRIRMDIRRTSTCGDATWERWDGMVILKHAHRNIPLECTA